LLFFRPSQPQKDIACAVLTFFLIFFSRQEAGAAVLLNSSISLAENYNSNLFFTAENQKSDFTTVLSPALDLSYTAKNVRISLGYQGSAQLHSKHSETDGYFQSLSFDIDLPFLNRQINGLEVQIKENVSYSPELPAFSFGEGGEEGTRSFDQVFLGGEGIQQSGRVNTFRNISGIILRYPWSQNFSTSGSYTNVITRYSGNDFEDSDINNVSSSAIYSSPLSSRTSWTLRYSVSSSLDDTRDLVHQVSLAGKHQITHLVLASANIGVYFVDGQAPNLSSGASLSKRYKSGRLNMRYSDDVVRGLGVIQGANRRQSLILSASWAFLERVSTSIQFGYVKNKSFEGDSINVSAYTAEAGLSTRFLSWLSGSLRYSYLQQESDGNIGIDAERSFVSLSLTANSSPWRIMK